MNIKSLLLGSAAALVAVSGARAADAVVMVEPEPVEYVRVCDVYGAGFYYIPGTETCLSVGGYVRFQVNFAGDPIINSEGDDYEVGTSVRARLNFDAREETELGTLRAFARVQATNTFTGSDAYEMDLAYIQLGGLLMGWTDSLWKGDVGGIGSGLLTDSDLIVGDLSANHVSYTFASGGFAATLALEDDATGDIVPDVHGKLTYSGAFGGVFLNAVYDETYNGSDGSDFTFNGIDLFVDDDFGPLFEDGDNSAFALKAGILLQDLFVAESQLKIEGHYAFDPTVYAEVTGIDSVSSIATDDQDANVLVTTDGLPIVLEYSIGAGYAQGIGDFGVGIAAQYGETFDTLYFVNGLAFETSGDYYAVVGNVGYELTNNFAVLGEVAYRNVGFDGFEDVDQTTGFLRFERSF